MSIETARLRLDVPPKMVDAEWRLDVSKAVQAEMFGALTQGGLYEPETTRTIAAILKPGDTFIDVGAHIGYFTVLGGHLVGPTGRVLAFEPNHENFARCEENVERNGTASWTTLREQAVGDYIGIAHLHRNLDNDGGHALWDPGLLENNPRSQKQPQVVDVPMTMLDESIRNVPPTLIKIDAEGSECMVLRGADALLSGANIPFVIAEINRFGLQEMGSSEQAVRGLMREYGYADCYLIPYTEEGKLEILPDDITVAGNHVFNLLWAAPGATF